MVTSEFQTDRPDGESSEIAEGAVASADQVSSGKSGSVMPPRPWGQWATIGWTLLSIVVLFFVQLAVLFVFSGIKIATDPSASLDALSADGNVVAFGTIASTPAVVGLTVLLARLRRYPIREYLALTWPPYRSVLIACAGATLLAITSDFASYLLGRPLVPPFMVAVYRTAWLPTLLLAILVLAPVAEEVLFRGFLYEGIAASRAGPVVAIIVSSIAWALLHSQYDWYGIVSVAVLGLYLGVVRYQTGSLLLTMVLHAVLNTVATLELIVQEHWFK